MRFIKPKLIYMDHASATPIDISIQKYVSKCEKILFANPNGIHTQSVEVRKVIDEARANIARAIGAHADEIIFTGSGTESDALAILGSIYKNSEVGLRYMPHIVTTTIEHSAVIENCKMLEHKGLAEVTFVPPEANGIVDPKKIEEALKENTVLVSVMHANNEIGTIQPIQEIAKVIRRFKKHSNKDNLFFHTDACQAMNYLFTENVDKLGVDLMTFNGSKIYGPKGIGILYKKRTVALAPIYEGGGQEMGLRPGTEDVSRIVGIARALEITNKLKNTELDRLKILIDYFFKQILSLEKVTGYKIHINGDRVNRLPNNINITIAGISSELLVIELDSRGIAVSSKSACKSTEEESSHVIHALRQAGDNFPSEESLRITLGRSTTMFDIKKLLKILEEILLKYKNWK